MDFSRVEKDYFGWLVTPEGDPIALERLGAAVYVATGWAVSKWARQPEAARGVRLGLCAEEIDQLTDAMRFKRASLSSEARYCLAETVALVSFIEPVTFLGFTYDNRP